MAQAPIVEKSDNQKGIIASIIYLLVLLFILFFVTYSEPDPPKVTVPIPIIMGDEGVTEFEIDNGGGGAPSAETDPVPQPVETPKEQPTQEEESPVSVNTGTGSSESNNTSSETATAPNPFSGSGSGGSGQSGSGGGFGNDDGPGSGSGNPGQGIEGNRVRLSNIHSKPKTPNNERCQIALKLTIDSQGKVLRADVDRNNTTTTNQRLIDEVIDLTKKDVKYKEKPGARNEIVYYTITVQPS